MRIFSGDYMGGRHFCVNTAGLRKLAGRAVKTDCLRKSKLTDVQVRPWGRRLNCPSAQQEQAQPQQHQDKLDECLQPKEAEARWWPQVHMLDDSTPSFSPTGSHSFAGATFSEGAPQELLQRVVDISRACRSVRGTANAQAVDAFRVECVQEKDNLVVWQVEQAGFSSKIACSEAVLPSGIPLEAFLWALYNTDERMRWDSKSLNICQQLRPASVVPGGATCDLIYCRMPAPTGLSDRDVVQERFLLTLPSTEGGGFAIVMRSSSEAAAEALGYPCGKVVGGKKAAVRANTILSGYVLQPLSGAGGGVRLTVMSQTDLGGSIPAWAQAMTKKVAMQRFSAWALRLQQHCEMRCASCGNQFVQTGSIENGDSAELAVAKAVRPAPRSKQMRSNLEALVLIVATFLLIQVCSHMGAT